MTDPSKTSALARLALVAGTALVLFVIEAAVPRPLPWMKLGLSNGAVLLALMLFGEIPDIWILPGGALIIAAAIYVALRERKIGKSVTATVPDIAAQDPVAKTPEGRHSGP